MQKMKDLQEQPTDELRALFHDLSKELFIMKNELSTAHKLDKPHLVSAKRRARARILTIMRGRGETL